MIKVSALRSQNGFPPDTVKFQMRPLAALLYLVTNYFNNSQITCASLIRVEVETIFAHIKDIIIFEAAAAELVNIHEFIQAMNRLSHEEFNRRKKLAAMMACMIELTDDDFKAGLDSGLTAEQLVEVCEFVLEGSFGDFVTVISGYTGEDQ